MSNRTWHFYRLADGECVGNVSAHDFRAIDEWVKVNTPAGCEAREEAGGENLLPHQKLQVTTRAAAAAQETTEP